MSTRRKIDGYAVQNTAHVLCALKAYAVSARVSTPGAAIQAAIDTYAALSQRRVAGRTVHRWLMVMESYGGMEKVPENAFGARKACPHIARPVQRKLREIAQIAHRNLSAKGRKGEALDARRAVELALIERAMSDCGTLVENDPLPSHLSSIRQTAWRLGNMPIHRLHRFASPAELEPALADILSRLQTLFAKRPGKAS